MKRFPATARRNSKPAIVVGIDVGVVSGLYPAWNGAKTDPIDALRYE